MNIVITVAEVVFLIVAFTVFNWLVGILFKLLTATWLGQAEKSLTLRQNIGLLLLLACVGLCLLIVSVNGVLIYQGKLISSPGSRPMQATLLESSLFILSDNQDLRNWYIEQGM